MASKKLVSLAVAVALTATSPITNAIGLGNLESQAVINQPLLINIPIIESNYEIHTFDAKLADRAMHDRMGIAYPSHLPKLYFSTSDSTKGPTLRVTSIRPIKEPIVNFLLHVSHGESNIVKEITLFLDPIEYVNRASDQILTPVGSTNKRGTDSIRSSVNPININRHLKQTLNPNTVIVKNGQSLWRIARSWNVGDVNINRKMSAIYSANPTAFVNGDRNRLKLGSQLILPTEALSHELVPKFQVKNEQSQEQSSLLKSSSKVVSNKLDHAKMAPESQLTMISTANTRVVSQDELQEKLQKQLALEKQLKDVNERIKAQLIVNTRLKDSLARATTQETNNAIEELFPTSQTNKKMATSNTNAAPTDLVQPVDEAFVGNFSSSEMTRNNWLLVIGVSLAILFVHILWIVSKNRKIKYFSRMLDLKFNKIASKSNKDEQMGHSVKKIKIPLGQSTGTQIKYLNSAAEFYIRCERFDLAKELVNESLIQFCNDPKIISAIGKIRIQIFKELDAHLHTNISSKSGEAIRPDPEMVIDIIDEFDMSEKEIKLDIPWNKKVS